MATKWISTVVSDVSDAVKHLSPSVKASDKSFDVEAKPFVLACNKEDFSMQPGSSHAGLSGPELSQSVSDSSPQVTAPKSDTDSVIVKNPVLQSKSAESAQVAVSEAISKDASLAHQKTEGGAPGTGDEEGSEPAEGGGPSSSGAIADAMNLQASRIDSQFIATDATQDVSKCPTVTDQVERSVGSTGLTRRPSTLGSPSTPLHSPDVTVGRHSTAVASVSAAAATTAGYVRNPLLSPSASPRYASVEAYVPREPVSGCVAHLLAGVPSCKVEPAEFFVAWQGVLTVAYAGLPPALVEVCVD